MISEEGKRNGGSSAYEAGAATDQAATKWDLTGRKSRMAPEGGLFTQACRLVKLRWLPEQISGRRKREAVRLERRSGFRISHEAIYALPRRELVGCLRHAKPARGRKPKGGALRGMTNIKDRPGEIEHRLVPSPWWERPHSRRQGGQFHRHAGCEDNPFPRAGPHPARTAEVESSAFADALNARPRKTLDFAKPDEHFKTLLAGMAGK
jgi:IS30 family transposase